MRLGELFPSRSFTLETSWPPNVVAVERTLRAMIAAAPVLPAPVETGVLVR